MKDHVDFAVTKKIHEFNNGVKVFDDQLTTYQRDRYKQNNVHEVVEEKVFVDILKHISQTGCFVNIGSAIGYYCLLAKKMVPNLEIHAVEPLARHRNFFKKNIAINGFSSRSFIVHNYAVSHHNGPSFLLDQDYGSFLLHPQSENLITSAIFFARKILNQRGKKFKFVYSITLERFLKIIEKPVDLLLMDVQGLEVEVLKSGFLCLQHGLIQNLIIGTHGAVEHQNCLKILQENGYRVIHDEVHSAVQPDGIIAATGAKFG